MDHPSVEALLSRAGLFKELGWGTMTQRTPRRRLPGSRQDDGLCSFLGQSCLAQCFHVEGEYFWRELRRQEFSIVGYR